MTCSDLVRVLSLDEIERELSKLAALLRGIPKTAVPCGRQHYAFENFRVSPEDAEEYGSEEAALNCTLEVTFCPGGRKAGPPVLREQGPGLVAVTNVLRHYIREFPTSVILQKWVFDLIESAKHHNAVPTPPQIEHTSEHDAVSRVGVALTTTIRKMSKALSAPSKGAKGAKFDLNDAPNDYAPADSDHDDRSEDSGSTADSEDSGHAGVSDNEGLGTNSVKAGKKRAKDSAKSKKQPKKKRKTHRESLLDRYEDFSPRDEKRSANQGGCPAADILDEVSVYTRLKADPKRERKIRCIGAATGCDQVWAWPRSKARVLKHASQCTHIPKHLRVRAMKANGSDSLSARVDKMLQKSQSECGHSETSKPRPYPDLQKLSRQAYLKGLQDRLSLKILNFFIAAGIPPSKADLPEWKELWEEGNRDYKPASATTMVDYQIPTEAARVHEQVLQFLKTQENLTISFDDYTTKARESIYTVHITTPNRDVFFWEGHEALDESHTAEYLYNQMLKPVIRQIRGTVKHFKKSSIATSHLKKEKEKAHMVKCQGLVSPAHTRFVSIYYSGESVHRNLPYIQILCKKGIVEFKDPKLTAVYTSSQWAIASFETELKRIICVLAPVAKACKCLESTESTVSDVFVFWLAVLSDIHDMIASGEDDEDLSAPFPILRTLSVSEKEEIRRKANYRYNRQFGKSDIYLTGFILDPRYRGSNILRDYNPLAIKPLKLSVTGKTANKQANNLKLPDSLMRAGQFLVNMLKIEYEIRKSPIAGLSAGDALDRLNEQVKTYVIGAYPFEKPLRASEGPRSWWLQVQKNEDSEPLATLAIIIFSLCPNSMSEERTASTFTWLNSHLRAHQKAGTLVHTTQLRQHILRQRKAKTGCKSAWSIPTVKFRDLEKTLAEARDHEGTARIVASKSGRKGASQNEGKPGKGTGPANELDTDSAEVEDDSESDDTDIDFLTGAFAKDLTLKDKHNVSEDLEFDSDVEAYTASGKIDLDNSVS
ncbi:hypothetical protein K474DRAFT_1713828 [Panus rudis PR-1116 ss-1]|nr:hypothetical protein K474DRAFT_1713828 [Panus rudis PR-1116 ss-1]